MHQTAFDKQGSQIRWTESKGIPDASRRNGGALNADARGGKDRQGSTSGGNERGGEELHGARPDVGVGQSEAGRDERCGDTRQPPLVYVHGLGSASTVYHAHVAADPRLATRRQLFVDLPGHGISDRPADFGYRLEELADALAAALDAAGVTGADIAGHSMGGAVAIVLASHRPDLVSRLVLTEANLDPNPAPKAGSSGIASYSEDDFVHGGGFAAVLDRVGPLWAATMRLADPLALHRTAVGLIHGTQPTMRHLLMDLPIDRTYLVGDRDNDLPGREELAASGVRIEVVPNAGHNIMFDNPEAFINAVAGSSRATLAG
ncbi:alpha/beta hydrolase [Streptomyces crystallinus]|uniref:AB hydrolase-1 domain-containing protein n=1 Tax=Streptomyces crystallinus TaxID=68191 RepID=A0ABP3QZQ1_9ACTN